MLGDTAIRPGAQLKVHQGNIDFNTGEVREYPLFTDTSGRSQTGTGAHVNLPGGVSFDIIQRAGKVRNFVNCSLPKQIRNDNYQPLTETELPTALENIEGKLYEAGIETKLENAKITRLDMNRDAITEEAVESYANLFALLKANRANNKKTYNVSGWLYGNTRLQYCIYNKIEEMKSKGADVSRLPKNSLRFEHRCMNGAKVKEFYKFTTVNELMAQGFGALEKRYSDTWRDNFFKYDVPDLEEMVESKLRTEMQYFQAIYGNRFFSKYLKAYGAYYLATSSGGIDVMKKALVNMECGRKRIYRAEKELTEAILEVEAMQPEAISRKSLGSLYNELKEKVCASF